MPEDQSMLAHMWILCRSKKMLMREATQEEPYICLIQIDGSNGLKKINVVRGIITFAVELTHKVCSPENAFDCLSYLGGEYYDTLVNALEGIIPAMQRIFNDGFVEVDYVDGVRKEWIDFGFISDKKMVNIESGHCSCAGEYFCAICDCIKSKMYEFSIAGRRGPWKSYSEDGDLLEQYPVVSFEVKCHR